MGSSEEEESGMESGVDTYSRSSSRRAEEREEVRESPSKVEEGETLEENEAGNSRKRKRSENTLDPKRMKVQGISKMCSNENNAAIGAGESEVENNNVLSGKFHLLPLQPQALNSPKSASKPSCSGSTPVLQSFSSPLSFAWLSFAILFFAAPSTKLSPFIDPATSPQPPTSS